MTNEFITVDDKNKQFIGHGDWNLTNLCKIQHDLSKITLPKSDTVTFDGADIGKMDSAGAWLLNHWTHELKKKKITLQRVHFSEQHEKLLLLLEEQGKSEIIPKPKHLGFVACIGKGTIQYVKESLLYLSFIGELSLESVRVFFHPTHIRLREIVSVIDKSGFQALPIIALLSFMIGVVISYQMGNQLRSYGANVFIVNLLGLSILREFGPLLTAIMVAGRTGSAFTAQLGIMKINQEIDALNTMSVPPSELLLLPRMIGLFIVLPLLTMWSNIFGIVGGMVMANNMLGINWHDFLLRFQNEIPLRALIIGLGKAPVFALLIASIGCFQGMQVRGSAESVGYRTTRSVVLAIFSIIIVDAIFSVLFSKFKL